MEASGNDHGARRSVELLGEEFDGGGVLAGARSALHILTAIAHQRADLRFAGVARVAYLPVFGGGGVEGKI